MFQKQRSNDKQNKEGKKSSDEGEPMDTEECEVGGHNARKKVRNLFEYFRMALDSIFIVYLVKRMMQLT